MARPSRSTPAAPSTDRFRGVMGRFATGVTVVTAHHEGRDAGMTVNAFLSVTLEPPTVLVSLSTGADTTPLVEASGRFAVSVLGAASSSLSPRFASRAGAKEKFEGVPFHRGVTGAPLLDGALATLECEVVERHPFATHVLFLGRVLAVHEGVDALPLVFWKGGYARPSHGNSLVMSVGRPSSRSRGRPRASPSNRRER